MALVMKLPGEDEVAMPIVPTKHGQVSSGKGSGVDDDVALVMKLPGAEKSEVIVTGAGGGEGVAVASDVETDDVTKRTSVAGLLLLGHLVI